MESAESEFNSKGNIHSKDELIVWLMKEYGKSLVRVAYTYVKQEQLAEDIVQEVFVKCYKKLHLFREESSYKTWLYKITINQCKDVRKSWNFKNLIFNNFSSFQSKPSNDRSPEEQMMVYEESKHISRMVISLPIKLREVIIFYYYEEMKIEQISELLGINRNTVKSRLLRGKQQLKKKIERGDQVGR
ncbi:RNA polymerase sigma-70 factor (ECF subfamily) [Fictibacillus halophilus]|uniref:RNA polymerase sigma-70 factor (ECF subfamily) n=1 Tax=Fictibacillus halophilus TaxID=1610490 RepID=A0ABV2LEV3_9BACL|nr:sigma-70 family RNA polymerase sigma factor [Fictibacillus halophilus]